VILLALDSRRDAIHQRLQALGVDVERAIQDGRYLTLDIADMLSQFMVDDWPDEALFQQAVAPIVADALNAATSLHPRVIVCGECAPTLWREGKPEAAVRIEELWDKHTQGQQVDTLCGYVFDAPLCPDREKVFRRISDVHTEVYSA
jgi:hypothetical protein